MAALTSPGPSAAPIARASTIPGMVRKISVVRMISSLTKPPENPAIAPSGTPMRKASETIASPIASEYRAPKTAREKTSPPRSSVPKRCAADGGKSASCVLTAPAASSGYGTMTGAKNAARMRRTTRPNPATAMRFCVKRTVCRRTLLGRAGATTASGAAVVAASTVTMAADQFSLIGDARIEHAVEQIDGEIDQDEDDANQQRDSHDGIEIEPPGRLHRVI